MTRVLRVVSAGIVGALSIGVIAMPASADRVHRASLLPATFSCTGAQQIYSVPAGVRALKVKAIGAAGGPSSDLFGGPGGSGGQGAVVGAWVRLPPATSTVYVEVGCAPPADSPAVGGFNGGGTGSNGGAGGGASDVRLHPRSTALTKSDTRLVVAGGGGGGGVCSGAGGAAGDSSVTGAGNGGNAAQGSDPCSPPTATAGGNGGFGGTAGGAVGTGQCSSDGAGSLGQGGSADTGCDPGYAGGAGGGGYYGGGAGGDPPGFAGGGGGGGSSFWVSGATHHSMRMNTTSLAPKVVLTPACLVPRLKGKTLAAAKTALTNAQCALGTVTKKVSTGKAGIVLSQTPKSGTILTIGSKVAVVVSKT